MNEERLGMDDERNEPQGWPTIARRVRRTDAMIVASALRAGCSILYSEDFQDGRVFEKHLTVRNPFRQA